MKKIMRNEERDEKKNERKADWKEKQIEEGQ